MHPKQLVAVPLHVDAQAIVAYPQLNSFVHHLRREMDFEMTLRRPIFYSVAQKVLEDAFKIGLRIKDRRRFVKIKRNGSAALDQVAFERRSEERRVGKECTDRLSSHMVREERKR